MCFVFLLLLLSTPIYIYYHIFICVSKMETSDKKKLLMQKCHHKTNAKKKLGSLFLMHTTKGDAELSWASCHSIKKDLKCDICTKTNMQRTQ